MSKPVFTAYTVSEYEKEGKKTAAWLKVGVAFQHKDGEGFDIILEAFPISGRLTLRKPQEKDQPAT